MAAMLTLKYLARVAKHALAVNMDHIWKECNPKHNTPLTEFTGQIVSLFNQVMNLLDGSLFNSSLISRNLKNRNLALSYVGYELQVDCLTQNTCPAEKGMVTDHYGLVLSLLLR